MSILTGVSVNMQHPSGLLLRLPPAQREARATSSCEFATEGHMLLCRNEFRSSRIFLMKNRGLPTMATGEAFPLGGVGTRAGQADPCSSSSLNEEMEKK